ncbi:TPA: hypothetical protein ACJYC6_002013 [Pseudomonas aeruginosa]|uniref:hypothetical protein n=1 Tax=Pseudomonas aeruginosa TaxID=287 RepID=UPI0004530446|nr:hypothetical protein [Pseudomonas aeruginosa]EKU7665020.1 hypothetical protein [Pseudomonas aeruginosa]EKU8168694.1 hypothetical protein [Pseudomonas aeruginosa]EKW8676408.1 hypothetical protein [Pseudomonas aeruginosa]EKY4111609.1 hypothetical protein [Pseudomonas aeruginosa]ELH7255202.1 hypothetical protein [Pseudomonas aeruginosa]
MTSIQQIILATTTAGALLILIATAYLAGRKDRQAALEEATNAAYLRGITVEREHTRALQADIATLNQRITEQANTIHQQCDQARHDDEAIMQALDDHQVLAALALTDSELDAIRNACRLLNGHARRFAKTGTTKRNADAEAQQQLAAILQRLAITDLASQSADAEAQEAA